MQDNHSNSSCQSQIAPPWIQLPTLLIGQPLPSNSDDVAN